MTKNQVNSLDDILSIIDLEENKRLSKNLYLDKDVLKKVSEFMDPFKRSNLDYKIQNISMLANDESIPPIERAITSIKKFDRMSESEVVTPSKVCKDMINLLPADGMRKIVANNNKFLDLGCKSAEYAVAIYNRLTEELGFKHNEVRNLIYTIPTSSIAYEFTRKFYEILDLNVDNIAIKFNAYDLLEIKDADGSINYEKIKTILEQNMNFIDIKLDDKVKAGDNKVKFGAVVGNPPYQISDGGAQASAKPIYQHFVLLGKELSIKYTCFITPTRWFAGGKGLDEFRDLMLNDRTMKELHDFTTPEDVFPNTNNRGGICYFMNDIEKNNDIVRVVTYKDDKVTSDVNRTLIVDGIDIFIRDSIGLGILDKIFRGNYEKNFSSIVSSRKPFGIESNIIKTKYFKTKKSDVNNPVLCIGRNLCKGYVDINLVSSNEQWIDTWKVYVPRANNIGTELNDDNLNSFVGEPKSICTEAYIIIGADLELSKDEALNISKYLTTKFVRYLHKQAKASHDASKKTYRFIPLQDFSENSDIEWAKDVDEIEEQLFNKYNLTEDERNHIKSSIKDM